MEVLANTRVVKNNQHVFSQQKLASQMPRGTRLDSTRTRLELKGSRNYTSHPICVGTDEIFEDIVIRGLRADGFSSKLGVRNNKGSIGKLISDVFDGDPRQEAVLAHFNSKRQRSNAAKTVYATMTHEELKVIHSELIPSKVDLKIRHRLRESFSRQEHKLQHCAEVLQHLQNSFATLDNETELLSIHNFQSRGFFVDVITSITNFLKQVVEDAHSPAVHNTATVHQVAELNDVRCGEKTLDYIYKEKEDKNAAEILLSVGAGGSHDGATGLPTLPHVTVEMDSLTEQCLTSRKHAEPRITTAEKNWTSLEILDAEGQPKCFLIKTPKQGNGTLDTDKLLQLLNEQVEVVGNPPNQNGIASDLNAYVESSNQLLASHAYTVPLSTNPQSITTLEISLDGNPTNCLSEKRINDDPSEMNSIKRFKT